MTRPARRPLHSRVAIGVEALVYLAWASAVKRILPSPRLARLLGPPADPSTAPRTRPDPEARRVGRVVAAVARRLPWETTCLPQALAVDRMLRRRGIGCESHLGVVSTAPFEAHAWVTVGGVAVVGGPVAHVTRLATFARPAAH